MWYENMGLTEMPTNIQLGIRLFDKAYLCSKCNKYFGYKAAFFFNDIDTDKNLLFCIPCIAEVFECEYDEKDLNALFAMLKLKNEMYPKFYTDKNNLYLVLAQKLETISDCSACIKRDIVGNYDTDMLRTVTYKGGDDYIYRFYDPDCFNLRLEAYFRAFMLSW